VRPTPVLLLLLINKALGNVPTPLQLPVFTLRLSPLKAVVKVTTTAVSGVLKGKDEPFMVIPAPGVQI